MGIDPLGLYSWGEYGSDVGKVFKGYGKALNGAFNPFEMANGVAQLAQVAGACGFEAAGNMMAQGIVHSFTDWLTTDDPEAFGESFGNVLITVGSELAPHATCLVKCFVEGTPVWMADGTTKPIEQIREGDFVLSFDATTGTVVASKVLATSVRESDTGTVSVTVESGGKRDVIECTPEHPLFVPGEGWTEAGRLGVGTSIVTRAGPNAGKAGFGETGTARVLSVVRHGSRRVTVCNFTVENTHTYFVATANGGIWAHNTCTTPTGFGALKDVPEMIEAPMRPTQPAVSGPKIDEMVEIMRKPAGEKGAWDWTGREIETHGDLIIDGHNRYVASRIAGIDPVFKPAKFTKPSPVGWEKVLVDTRRWDGAYGR